MTMTTQQQGMVLVIMTYVGCMVLGATLVEVHKLPHILSSLGCLANNDDNTDHETALAYLS